MKLNDIREKRAAMVGEMRSILNTAESQKRSLSADEQTKFDSIKQQVTDLEEQESRAQFLEEQERRMIGQNSTEQRGMNQLENRVSVLRILQNQLEGRSLNGAELEYAQETERRTGRKAQGIFVPLSAFEKRVNTTGSAGSLVPTDHRADQYIEPFRNALIARQLGVRVLSGLQGDVSIPKHGSGTVVGWVGENESLPTGDMTFKSVGLTPKHAGGITEMSRQLIQQSSPACEQLITDDISFMLAQAIDSALFVGGKPKEPKGVLSTTGIQTASLATLSWENILLMFQQLKLVNANAVNFVGSTKAEAKLAGTLKEAGIAGYLLENGLINNKPAYFANQLPDADATNGRLILGDWSQVLLGIWSEIDLLVNPYDSEAYERGGVKIRAMATCDIAIRHPEGFVVAEDIAI